MLPLLFVPWIALATPTAPVQVAGVDCVEAPRVQLEVPGGYDTVRVVTAPGAAGASVVVSVASADRWASVTARGGGPTSLQLGLGGGGAAVFAVEPDLDAAAGACVERIELLRGGELVAHVDLRASVAAPAPASTAGSW